MMNTDGTLYTSSPPAPSSLELEAEVAKYLLHLKRFSQGDDDSKTKESNANRVEVLRRMEREEGKALKERAANEERDQLNRCKTMTPGENNNASNSVTGSIPAILKSIANPGKTMEKLLFPVTASDESTEASTNPSIDTNMNVADAPMTNNQQNDIF